MPTENRSSNTEQMVSVPMSMLEKCLHDARLVRFTCDKHVLHLQDLLAHTAPQHQGEPVVLPACKAKLSMSHDWDQGYSEGWSACLDEIAKLGPLYARAAVERQP
ncbi:hypothetical protein MF6396_16855 [Pseudomonas sp. MF6396]|uniref:hypothetical protein n=1 Tax=Pseudomonas sp. MF6396 TaxID=1960828 RepID=UPI000996721B|nr:hypothetical protein [Pseudomonas sp. MF6396]OOW00005.1 hypothetical protein MF6396_16855 [Pseudomonas sp. MF6396]